MLIGYVRVSTNDQNTDLQRNALNSAECELIFEDKISGTTEKTRGNKKTANLIISGFALNQNNPLTELAALLRDDVTLSLKPDSISLNDEDCRRSRKSSSQRSRVRENSIFFAFP